MAKPGNLFRWIQRVYSSNRLIRAAIKEFPGSEVVDELLRLEEEGISDSRFFHRIDKEFLSRQGKQSIKGMLHTSIGDWPLIAQRQDLARDLAADILARIRDQQSGPALMVLLGEPGAGKTTLTRRIGMDLALEGRQVLELRPGLHLNQEWYSFVADLRDADKPPIVLINDIFRCDGIDALLTDPGLEAVIIGNSRINEDLSNKLRTTGSLRFLRFASEPAQKPQWPILTAPSAGELAALRQRDECSGYTDLEWVRLTSINRGGNRVAAPLLVIMLQLAGRHPFDQIISDATRQLQKLHPDMAKAFGVICAFHRLGLETPAPTLERLMPEYPDLSRKLTQDVVLEKKAHGVRGLIFRGGHPHYQLSWRAGHELIAEAATQSDYSDVVEDIYLKAFELPAILPDEEREFLTSVFATLIRRGQRPLAQLLRPRIAAHFHRFVSPENAGIWARAFASLDDRERALACLQLAVPKNPHVALLVVILLERFGDTHRATSFAADWLANHLDDTVVRVRYLGLVGRTGTPGDMETTIEAADAWLDLHPEDNYVRTAFLSLVVRSGQSKQVTAVMKKTGLWLDAHPDDTVVRTGYLSVVERAAADAARMRGPGHGETDAALGNVEGWLHSHPDNSSVRSRYFGLVERHGTPDQIRRAIVETEHWLDSRGWDTAVRTAYLGLVKRKGDHRQVETALKKISSWLGDNPNVTDVRTAFLGFVERVARDDRIATVLIETGNWLDAHPDVTDVRTAYLGLIERKGSIDQIATAVEEISAWLDARPEDVTVRTAYLDLVEASADQQRIESTLTKTLDWVKSHSELSVLYGFLSLAVKSRQPDLKKQIATSFRSRAPEFGKQEGWVLGVCAALSTSFLTPDEVRSLYQVALSRPNKRPWQTRTAYGRFLTEIGDYSAAEKELLFVCGKMPHHAVALDLLAKCHAELGRTNEAEAAWRRSILNAARKAFFRTNFARFLRDLGRYREAREELVKAVEEWPECFPAETDLGELDLLEGNRDSARSHFDAAVRKVPSHGTYDLQREAIFERIKVVFGEPKKEP